VTTAVSAAPSAADTPLRPRKRSKPSLQQALVGWSFALPFVVLFGVFLAGPIVVSFLTSFTDLRVTDIRSPLGVNFVGLENYADVFGDPAFRKAAVNTVVYVLFAVPLTIGLGLLIALALNQGVVRLRNVFRLGFFLPYVTSVIAIAIVWRLLLGSESGLINGLLDSIGIDGPGWLIDTRYSLASMIIMTTWRGLGLQMIIFLAGLQAIPITEPVARVHADTWAGLSERGEPIGAHDLWIAATALAHELGVATRNASHFDRVPGLRVVAPLPDATA